LTLKNVTLMMDDDGICNFFAPTLPCEQNTKLYQRRRFAIRSLRSDCPFFYTYMCDRHSRAR